MKRAVQSQWDFDDRPVTEAARRVFTVAELTAGIRKLLERDWTGITVSGEISNLRVQSSGHAYFTLKDSTAQLNCVLFRSAPAGHRALLEDGRKVLLLGDVTVYEPRGQYQLVVRTVEPLGLGALQLAFEKLKQKLQSEGLFDPSRKRPMPRYPARIGLVTSPTGAAIRDVLHVIRRRHPGLQIILVPCRVQGDGAADEIVNALDLLNEWAARPGDSGSQGGTALDLILVTRGGGSLEDLWPFNEERVARAIVRSRIPVVSAVGHEIDFTISDLAADLRAATPSAAAEILTEGVHASREFVAGAVGWMSRWVRRQVDRGHQDLDGLANRIERAHPRRWLNERAGVLEDLVDTLTRAARRQLRMRRVHEEGLRQRLHQLRPRQRVARHRETLAGLGRRLGESARIGLREAASRVSAARDRLRLLSPLNVLDRGYSITRDAATGRVLHDAASVRQGQRLRTRLSKGEIESVAEV